MNKFKGVVFDIDNTLYSHSQHKIPSLTLKALKLLREAGYKIAFCTSRFPAEFCSLPKNIFEYADMVISGTGSILIVNGEIIENFTLSNDIAEKYTSYFDRNENTCYLWISKNGEYYFSKEPDQRTTKHCSEWMGACPGIKKWSNEELVSISYYNMTEEQLREFETMEMDVSVEKWGNVGQINAKGIDKGFGVKYFAEYFGFSAEEVVCFGDGANDISMIDGCGIGVAVSTGSQQLIEAADYVCNPIENGGIYEMCVELALIKPIDSQIFFFDIDGTTYLHSIHDNPETTKIALRKLKENGKKLFICTSRSYDEMKMLPKDFLSIMDGIICLAGAQRLINDKHELLVMDESVKECIKYLDEQGITYRYVTGDEEGYLNQADEDKEALFYRLYLMTPPIKKYEGEDVIHLLCYVKNDEQVEYIAKNFEKLFMIRFKAAIELTAGIMDKGCALQEVSEQLGYSIEQTVAFGDGFNDATMLEKAYIGVALGNATEGCKEAADYVTDNIEDDGLYNACLRFKWIDE